MQEGEAEAVSPARARKAICPESHLIVISDVNPWSAGKRGFAPESWQMENWEIGIAIPFPPRVESGPRCDHSSPERARTGPPIKARCNCWSWSQRKQQGSLIRAKSPDEGSSKLRARRFSRQPLGETADRRSKGNGVRAWGPGKVKIGSRDCQRSGVVKQLSVDG